jgi:DNA-binding NtrC family response regulator
MQEKPTILIVDDNAPFRMLVRAFLMKEDYRVIEAENGLQAMEMLDESKPGLLLLDLQMQPMGGFDFMVEYNNREYKMPVVLITADPSSDILTRSSKLGFAGVLKKPVNEERILQIVKRFI